MHRSDHRSGLFAPVLFLSLFLGGFGPHVRADMLGSRYGDETRAKDALMKSLRDADLVCSGVFVELLTATEGAFHIKDQSVQGHWYKAKIRVNNVIKGANVGKDIVVRFFVPSHGGADIFPLPPDKGACLLFLDKAADVEPPFSIAPSSDPILSLPDSHVDLDGVTNISTRLKTVLLDAVETGDSSYAPRALELALLLTDKDERLALLQGLIMKPSSLLKGIFYAHSLSLGDLSAADAIDRLLATKDLSDAESSVIATVVADQDDATLKPFLVKWAACDYPVISEAAYQTLATFADRSMVPLLISALDHTNSLVRLRALHSLTKIEGARQKDGQVLRFTRDNDKEAVRQWKLWWKEKGKARFQGEANGTNGGTNGVTSGH